MTVEYFWGATQQYEYTNNTYAICWNKDICIYWLIQDWKLRNITTSYLSPITNALWNTDIPLKLWNIKSWKIFKNIKDWLKFLSPYID